MNLTPGTLVEINPRLIPLIAHDRAGFGGGVATAGLLLLASVWSGALTRSPWQALDRRAGRLEHRDRRASLDRLHRPRPPVPGRLGAALFFSGWR